MLRLNEEKIKEKSDELKHFKGFLPFQFDSYVNLTKRKEFLQKNGLWDEVHNQELSVMQGIRDSKPNDDAYMDKILKRWLRDNPEFKDLVIFD